MATFDPSMNADFREYAALLLRRHRLLIVGQEDDPAMDGVEDRMTALWENLDETQRQSVRGMSSDLNWIRRNGRSAPKGRQTGDVTPEDRQALLKAKLENEWHAILHYLRLCASVMSPVNLAYLRGQAYQAIGLKGYSTAFYDQAVEFEPGNGSMRVIAMRAADREDPENALQRARDTLQSPLTHPPVAVVMSIAMTLRRLEEEGAEINSQHYSGLLQEAIARLDLEPPSESVRTMVYQFAASAFEILGDLPWALRCYEEGLRLAPENEALQIGIGLLLYGSQTERAVEAFSSAVRKATPLVWPYYFLAHYYVRRGQYDSSLQMGRLAWARAATDPVRAELLEWQAICLCELDYPVEVVRSLFEKAAALDPDNESIQANLAGFAEAIGNVDRAVWEIEEERTLKVERASRVSELELAGVP
jgi:tetratricopeptide (TPR) repeat protein